MLAQWLEQGEPTVDESVSTWVFFSVGKRHDLRCLEENVFFSLHHE